MLSLRVRNGLLLGVSVALSGAAMACTAITDTGEFEQRQEPLQCGNELGSVRNDMTLTLTKMNAHLNNLVIADLVRIEGGAGGTRTQIARTVWDPLSAETVEMRLPCTVLAGNYDVDIFADLNDSQSYDPCVRDPAGLTCADHQWRLRLQAGGTLSYEHDVDFVNIIEEQATPRGGLPLTLSLSNMDEFVGMAAVVRVRLIDETRDAEDEVIFEYRRAQIPDMTGPRPVALVAQNLVTRGERFKIAIWIDTNMNGIYDPPAEGHDGRDYATLIDGLAEPIEGVRVLFDGSLPPPPFDVRF